MATDATRIFVAQMARVYLGDVGATAPTLPTGGTLTGWTEVGLFTPDSLAWATEPSFEEVRSHQSKFPTRRFQTEDAATVSVDLQEWSAANFKAVFGGGTVVETEEDSGVFKFTPPAIGGRTATACFLQFDDGSRHFRRIIPKCEQAEGAEQTFNATSESILPLRLSVLGADVGDAWYDLTDDPAFAPA